MRSIRLRRRSGSASPSSSIGAPVDQDLAAVDRWLPRELLPVAHRAGYDRAVLARRLRVLAHPRFYAAQVGDPALADDVDGAIAHFLREGLRVGRRISGLFNPDVYRGRLEEAGVDLGADEDLFLHFLLVGWEERVVPTVLFDEAFYLGRHPDLSTGPEWGFAQYARAGCYASGRSPTPFGPNYGGVPAVDARERQDPPLVAGLLHRAADYDLSRSSWLEEGVQAGATKLAALDSDRMRALVTKAAAIEPLVAATPRERWVSWPPHTHPMVIPAARAEDVRRTLGLVRADTVLVVPGGQNVGAGLRAVVEALRVGEPEATVLVVTTDEPGSPGGAGAAVTSGFATVDLSVPWAEFAGHRRLLGLLDLVRGVRPQRLVVSESELGWKLLSSYATTLRHEMSLAAVITDSGPTSSEDFQGVFDLLSWVATDTESLRDELVARFVLPSTAAARVLGPSALAAGDLDPALRSDPEDLRRA